MTEIICFIADLHHSHQRSDVTGAAVLLHFVSLNLPQQAPRDELFSCDAAFWDACNVGEKIHVNNIENIKKQK